jgi:hypothetical protein
MREEHEQMDMMLDMTGREVVILTALAHIGGAVMAKNFANIERLVRLLNDQDDAEDVAVSAMQKLEAGLRLAKTMSTPSNGMVS